LFHEKARKWHFNLIGPAFYSFYASAAFLDINFTSISGYSPQTALFSVPVRFPKREYSKFTRRLKMDHKRLSALLVSLTVLVAWMSQGMAISEEAKQQGIPSLAPMLETVTPAVVNIQVVKSMPTSTRFFFNSEELPDAVKRYFEQNPNFGRERSPRPFAQGAGSGVIIDSDLGYIVTNHHVIDDAATITV